MNNVQSGSGGVTLVGLDSLETDEDTFQHRLGRWERTYEGREQIKDLIRHLKNTQEPLTPITVYPRDGKYVVIDGHHRLKAYQEVWWLKPVPVTVFHGGLRDAKELAFEANGKGQRSYTLQERQEKAWDYTKEWFFDGMKELTKEWTAKRAGIAEGTVATMRRTIRAKGEEARDLSWVEASWKNPEEASYTPDPEWKQKKTEELRKALLELDVIHYAKSPDILADALSMISPNIPRALVAQWAPIAFEVTDMLRWEEDQLEEAKDAGLVPLGPPI